MRSHPSAPERPRGVLIVDDHPMMRLGLRQYLEQEPGLEVCGEAGNAVEALIALETLQPHLVLLDISLQGRSGLDLLTEMRTRFPRTPVLVHSMHDQAIYAERALRAGARGYLMKQETGEKLLEAVRQVLAGGVYLSEQARARVPRRARRRNPGSRTGATRISMLTDREFEVFRLIGRGFTNAEIARHLNLSVKTIDAHREHIKRKLDVNSTTALNLLAVKWESEQTV